MGIVGRLAPEQPHLSGVTPSVGGKKKDFENVFFFGILEIESTTQSNVHSTCMKYLVFFHSNGSMAFLRKNCVCIMGVAGASRDFRRASDSI